MKKLTEEEQQAALRLCNKAMESEEDNAWKIVPKRSAIVGSAYISGEGNDIDCLFFVPDVDVDCIGFPGWSYGGSVGEGNESHWGSWTNGHVNMLITSDETYFQAWMTSAEVCRFLSLRKIGLTRDERVSIHNIVMDDSTAEDETEIIAKEPAWVSVLN